MTVSDLIKLLADLPADAEVFLLRDDEYSFVTTVRMVEYRPAARPNHPDIVLIE
jgi:hypothetical protein